MQIEIADVLKAFYCSLCDKQFKNVAQYDEHTNSYAHHHKARFKDMQASVRVKPQEEVDKRKEKERKREEKELRKIAAANGIKMAKPASIAGPSVTGMNTDSDPTDALKFTWETTESPSGFKKSGWATVGSSPNPPPPAPRSHEPSAFASHQHPGFRTAGWASLDTGISQQFAPPSIPLPPSPPPPEAPLPQPQSRGGWASFSGPSLPDLLASAAIAVPTVPSQPYVSDAPSKAQASRSGWQKFQSSKRR